jgi:transcriptional regulator GlxA family with amidase domain
MSMKAQTGPAGERAAGAGNRRRVGILLFDDVEVLDFAGPFEVFGVSRFDGGEPAFEVVTFALAPGEIVARNGLRIIPTCAAEDLGEVDIFVVPGGAGTRRELACPRMLEAVRAASLGAELTLSVCTGALLLGAAGLLAGRSATTHSDAVEELRSLNTGAIIFPNARIVDNGALVTSAGISAGIDAALYIVARLLGLRLAEETARYMQYDWVHTAVDGRHVIRAGD